MVSQVFINRTEDRTDGGRTFIAAEPIPAGSEVLFTGSGKVYSRGRPISPLDQNQQFVDRMSAYDRAIFMRAFQLFDAGKDCAKWDGDQLRFASTIVRRALRMFEGWGLVTLNHYPEKNQRSSIFTKDQWGKLKSFALTEKGYDVVRLILVQFPAYAGYEKHRKTRLGPALRIVRENDARFSPDSGTWFVPGDPAFDDEGNLKPGWTIIGPPTWAQRLARRFRFRLRVRIPRPSIGNWRLQLPIRWPVRRSYYDPFE